MATTFSGRKRIRKHFGKIREVAPMPNLIEVQKSSYDLFLESGDGPTPIDGEGLQGVFQSVFPIKDFNDTAVLEFERYELEPPKYDVEECQQRDMTYAAPLKVTLRLIVFEVDEDTGARSVKDMKEQDVYMGDMPLMTRHGTFIVNGTERVIVSQMHRSPGVFFDHDKGKTHASGKLLFAVAHHPLSRLLARFRVRRQGHRVRPHRPPPQAAGHHAALRAGPRSGGDLRHVLQPRDLSPRGRWLGGAVRHRPPQGRQADP
jgi:DNA-directed RNA polymerase beta subunit